MGVYIKGMKMPKSCFYCPFRRKINPDDIQCLVTRDVFEETFAGTIESRNRGNCPLIELKPHGRLIDADALNDMINRSYPMTDRADVHNGYAICQEMIKQLPTIIEAEGE